MTFDLVLLGLACSLEPIPLTAFILTLSTDNGRRNGLAFLAGWVVSLVVVIALTLALTDGEPPAPSTAPSEGILAAKILIGVALLLFAWHYHRRPAKEPARPKWMKRLDNMSAWTAVVVAMLVQPWGLIAAGALSITQADTSNASDVAAIIAFAVLACISLFAMQAYAMVAPASAQARLTGLREWIDAHRAEVIVYISLVIGLYLIGKSTYSLIT